MLSMIAAIADDNVIGKDNQLIWRLPEDLKRFRELTTNHTIIMGRKTFESLGRILPNRMHVVLSNDKEIEIDNQQVRVVKDIKDIEQYIYSEEENFVIGGATIYKLLMPYAHKMYITKINQKFEGDAFFPEINDLEWTIISKEKGLKDEKNSYDYEYVNYIRNC